MRATTDALAGVREQQEGAMEGLWAAASALCAAWGRHGAVCLQTGEAMRLVQAAPVCAHSRDTNQQQL